MLIAAKLATKLATNKILNILSPLLIKTLPQMVGDAYMRHLPFAAYTRFATVSGYLPLFSFKHFLNLLRLCFSKLVIEFS
jgi:hypothetical protein